MRLTLNSRAKRAETLNNKSRVVSYMAGTLCVSGDNNYICISVYYGCHFLFKIRTFDQS